MNKKAIYLLLFVVALVLIYGYIDIKNRFATIENEKYTIVANSLQERVQNLITDKQSSTLAIALALSQNNDIVTTIKNQVFDTIPLGKISADLKTLTDYKNVWIQLIDVHGTSLYRSWTPNTGDNLYDIRSDLREVIRTKQLNSTISVGIFSMTFKSMVPIFDNEELVGVIEIITHFNSIAKKLEEDNIKSVVLVDKQFKKQLTRPITKQFINDYYVATFENDPNYISLLGIHGVENIIKVEDYIIIDDNLITSREIKSIDDEVIGYYIIFKKMSDIEHTDLNTFKLLLIMFLVVLVLSVLTFLFLIRNHEKSLLIASNLEIQSDLNEQLQKQLVIIDNERKENIKIAKELNDAFAKLQFEIEENKKKDLLLQQQARLAALGEMIGNIAHQWRQPLSAITSSISGLRLKQEFGLLEDKDISQTSEDIIKSANFLSKTIDDFRNFFKKEREVVDFFIDEVIKNTLDITKAGYQNDSIIVEFDAEHIKYRGCPTELTQVILNILSNAADAFNSNNIDGSDRYVKIVTKTTEEFVEIGITDSAGGIEPHILEKIFDPYFTTKHQSIGTGIGLYMSSEIIKNTFNGNIYAINDTMNINNKSYKGAKFIIELPFLETRE
ncbi:MAG: ATP-binding protein [Arcobacteraceae bacterium]|nr:ATP-binding protein [Arcobacteraceae bacterium]